MKNTIRKISSLLFVFIITFTIFSNVYANDANNKEIFKIYAIKEKEEVLVENNKIIEFYEETHDEIEVLIERKRLELEKAARIKFKQEVVNYAKQFVGNPYVLGGNSLVYGTDCSGFTKLVYGHFGIVLPRGSYDQASFGEYVELDDIEIGDIVAYSFDGISPGHVALYLGDGLVIHSSIPELGIRIDKLNSMPLYSVRRVA